MACIATAALVGTLLGAVGGVLGVPVATVPAVAVVSLFLMSPWTPWQFPSSPWQVPKAWGGPSRWRNGAYFGIPLGTGFATALPGAGLYALGATCLVLPPAVAGTVFAAFGAARAAPLVLAWFSPYGDAAELLPLERVARAQTTVVVEAALLLALVCSSLLITT